MKKEARKKRRGGLILLFLFLLMAAAAILWKSFPSTPPVREIGIGIDSNVVAELEPVQIGGITQWLLIRGQNPGDPVLLFLSGGPGLSEMGLFRHFNQALESHFVVVNWDQRGAGKSYSKETAASPWELETFITDTRDVVEYLKHRFEKNKIYLAGHSWGSLLGTLVVDRFPESFHAYVGIGQWSDPAESERISYEFTLERARILSNFKAERELEAIGPPAAGRYHGGIEAMAVQRKWLMRFGGNLLGKKTLNPLRWHMLLAREYSLKDLFRLQRGFNLPERSRMIEDVLMGINLVERVPRLKVPVYFFLGRLDYLTSSEAAEAYFKVLRAPRKDLVWFEKSAHYPCFEEAELFNQMLVEKVRAETYRGE